MLNDLNKLDYWHSFSDEEQARIMQEIAAEANFSAEKEVYREQAWDPNKYARKIAHTVAAEVLQRGPNVILDADYVMEEKRVALQEEVRKVGAQLAFLATYVGDPVVMFGRVLTAHYQKVQDDFFGGAKTV